MRVFKKSGVFMNITCHYCSLKITKSAKYNYFISYFLNKILNKKVSRSYKRDSSNREHSYRMEFWPNL